MRPLALAFGKFHKVGYGFRRFFFKEAADDGSFGRVKNGVSTPWTAHKYIFSCGGRTLILTGGEENELRSAIAIRASIGRMRIELQC
jgi:hypothetical protein